MSLCDRRKGAQGGGGIEQRFGNRAGNFFALPVSELGRGYIVYILFFYL